MFAISSGSFDEISVEELKENLDNIEERKPSEWLLTTIAYKNGVAQTDLAFVRLSAYSLELNPVEECWRQLQSALSNQFFDSLSELTTAIDTALDHFSIPKVSNYF